MKAYLLLFFSASLLFTACEKQEEDLGFSILFSWEQSGGMDPSSSNNVHVKFNVFKSGNVGVSINSMDVESYIYLLDKEKNILIETDAKKISTTLGVGEYEIVFATKSAGETGDFWTTFIGEISFR